MVTEVFEVSRREFERWIVAGTLEISRFGQRIDTDDAYVLVALTAVFASRWDAHWTPCVTETMASESEAMDWARVMDDEILADGNLCQCFEVWHIVDDDDYDPFDVQALLAYDCARANLADAGIDDDELVRFSISIVSWFNRYYELAVDLRSFYPVETLLHGPHYDLVRARSELRNLNELHELRDAAKAEV